MNVYTLEDIFYLYEAVISAGISKWGKSNE